MSKSRHTLTRIRTHLKKVEALIETMAKIKTADSALVRVLGVFAMLGHGIDLFQEGTGSASRWLSENQFRTFATGPMAELLKPMVRDTFPNPKILQFEQYDPQVEVFENGIVTTTYPGSSWSTPLRVQDGVNIAKVVSNIFWANHNAMEIVMQDAGDGGVTPSVKPLSPAGDYCGGAVSLEETASLLRGGGSILLIGTTGTGKTTFARLLANHLRPGRVGRVLRISGTALLHMNPRNVADLTQWTNPDVLVIEDLQGLFSTDNKTILATQEATFLSMLETVREYGGVVIGTMMVTPDKIADMEAMKPGSMYFDGLRPGRFDHVRLFPPLTQAQREIVLRHYVQKPVDDATITRIVGQTEGLSGAYLKVIAGLLDQQDPDLDLAVRRILAFAPAVAAKTSEPNKATEPDIPMKA